MPAWRGIEMPVGGDPAIPAWTHTGLPSWRRADVAIRRTHSYAFDEGTWAASRLARFVRATAPILLVAVVLGASRLSAQVENVPAGNQVYDFLDRLGVRGVLPTFSTVVVPLSRREVAELLQAATGRDSLLSDAERAYLKKFMREFAHDLGLPDDRYQVIGPHDSFGDFMEGSVSDREKYLYAYTDSSASIFVEFLGSYEHRPVWGDTYGDTHVALGSIGGRIRGTALDKFGYYLQATNGQLWGDRAFALSDPRLAGNVKFNDLGSPYFDFTEAYVKLQLGWFDIQFGREFKSVGIGYTDRTVLSGVAPAFDFIGFSAHYKSFRFDFFHGTLVQDTLFFEGLPITAPEGARKYLSLHRFKFSLFSTANIGLGEMVIYQRVAPEFAYLNPVNFYKSAEHSLGDQDNAFIFFDLELFPRRNLKAYGSWVIDDIDFGKMGTGWWGNQFAWHAGVINTDLAGLRDIDGLVEYVRVEPYTYSNRLAGNDYTHTNVALGSHLAPNSDAWAFELRYRPSERWRFSLGYAHDRHGNNIVDGDSVMRNVGADVFEGHRPGDAESVTFLDGIRESTDHYRARVDFEPVTNIFLLAAMEFRSTTVAGVRSKDLLARIQLRLDY